MARARLAAAGAAWIVTASGCALPPARWDVRPGSEPRFDAARRACRQLTCPGDERFEDCMERRGFERESLWKRGWRALWSLDESTALANELRHGVEVIRSGETREGAARFAAGAGRHGSFA